ncbi:alpha/beta hydrolase family protein [Microterricola pindariensis]|uniref:AB hydrolase-1 domain-containing protein n=1 Tax=Microterricola pindariensis TaxID=478010 RepID=A0ABX5ATU6_9MICO|nr:hypothetical protein [Microterricola pindariensis]PPL17206.1 hypothetical protein GY24_11785 [Microterricola pindariensis]
MADTLTLSGGGSSAVATDEMFAHAAQLGACQARAEDWLARLRAVLAADTAGEVGAAGSAGVGWGVGAGGAAEPGSTELLGEALRRLQAFQATAERLRAGLTRAAEGYGHAERTIAALWGAGAQFSAWTAGRALPLLLASAALTLLPLAALGVLLSTGFGVDPARLPARLSTLVARWVLADPWLLNSPGFVKLVRAAIGSGDEFAAGLLRLPAAAALPIGAAVGAEEGAAAVTALALFAAAAGSQALRETPQRVHRASQALAVSPPRGIGDLAARVPNSAAGSPQIRIERYGGSAPRWVVYLAGTADFAVTPAAEPFDLTANVHATAGGDAASQRAVRAALAEAGAEQDDPLLLVGHSQGGLVAARLAESGDLNVAGYVNLGGPLGAVQASGVPGLSLEHADDIVPALGGSGRAPDELLTVGRTALGIGDAGPHANSAQRPFAAHGLEHYRHTARLVDASTEPRLQGFERLVQGFTGAEPGRMTRWRSERVPGTE